MQIVRTGDLLQAALGYAAVGVPVFPCRSSDSDGRDAKSPLTTHGYKEATTDAAVITEWWSRHPDAAIGVPTGAPGHTVLDVDVRDDGDGYPALEILRECGLLRGCVRVVRTTRGGCHLYYPGTEQCGTTLADLHLDLRGVGGYVIVPPSRVEIDQQIWVYEEVERGTGGRPLDWSACREVLSSVPASSSGSALAHVVGSAAVGNRNNALYWAACRALERGEPMEPIVRAALSAGLSQAEVAATVASARRTLGDRA